MDLDVFSGGEEKMTAREFLYKNLKAKNEEYFGNNDKKWLSYVCDAWMNDESNSKHRYDMMRSIIGDGKLKKLRILDMSSGCGTFVFYGLLNGYDVYGIEPEEWKSKFNKMKIKLYGYPKIWRSRFIGAFGENLPFQDECFDVVSSYQTLEHVSDVKTCLQDMLRVVKEGGSIFLHFPDYRSTFEGHYRLPWMPLFPKSLARVYLRMLGKSPLGLNSINYVTKKNVMHLLRQNDRVELTDLDKVFFQRRTENIIRNSILKQIDALGSILAVMINLVYTYFYTPISRVFRSEKNVTILVRKL